MKRKTFIQLVGSGLLTTGFNNSQSFITTSNDKLLKWVKANKSSLFTQCYGQGEPFVKSETLGLLNAQCILLENGEEDDKIALSPGREKAEKKQIAVHLRHRLYDVHPEGGEDLLEASLVIRNKSRNTRQLRLQFTTSAQSSSKFSKQHIYIPVSAAGLNRDKRLSALGSLNFFTECNQAVGMGDFECHYMEPMASNPKRESTQAMILAPVVVSHYPDTTWNVAIFTSAEEAFEFKTTKDKQHTIGWIAGKQLQLAPGEEVSFRCYLYIYQGDAGEAWTAFHKLAYPKNLQTPDWLYEAKVHYYDFLSSAIGENGKRGNGYEADLAYFKDFHVGMATQHGYYPYLGDYIQPDRKQWLAMKGDSQGAVEMSLQKMQERIAQTRRQGSRAAIYLHAVMLDEGSPIFQEFKDARLVDKEGKPVSYGWSGPDTAKNNWNMSFASKQWSSHLLKQAELIMELLDTDAIVVDETFMCLGYDWHPDRKGALSQHSISFFKNLYELVHSYGSDKALLSSDVSMANMGMWCDGEAGDHTYGPLLGDPLYRKEPIRYQSVLGDKPWLPGAWFFVKFWEEQMDLARKKKNAGVGVGNGWKEFTGLHALPHNEANKIKNDIKSII
ncbi:hypothetical protein [Halalkalibaculum sp. DA384]|uniref:hypothetical protein n=1 Tax=Halalkalibaculum sp. DA384 TaxID=3373606 RepID=UPI003754619D